MIIDSDQHLFEYRGLWEEHIDPRARDEALRLTDDDLGHTWVTWRGRRLGFADAPRPGQTDAVGERYRRAREGRPPLARYEDTLPDDYWQPAARLERLADLGVDEAILFPNYGLLWERTLDESLPALQLNMTAWNRWAATVAAEGRGRLHPVAHLTLRDLDWLDRELGVLAAAGLRLAMIAPALVDGRPLSHPDLDRAWAAFVAHGVTPVFHVADQRRPFADARIGVPVDGGRPGVHRPHRERRARAPSRPAARHRRALGGVGPALSDDARRGRAVHVALERPRPRPALASPERLFS